MRHAIRVAAVGLLLGGCAPEAEPPGPENPAPGPEPLVMSQAVDDVLLDSPRDLAAQAPLGRLRVALDPDASDAFGGAPAFQHLRGDGSDLSLVVVGGIGDVAEPAAWSASPGRLTGAAPDGSWSVSVVAGADDALYRFVVPPGARLELALAWRAGPGEAGPEKAFLAPARGRRDLSGVLKRENGQALFLAARFDRSFDLADAPDSPPGDSAMQESPGTGRVLRFQPPDGVVHLRLALSSVDAAAARAQLGADDFDFLTQWTSVREAWNRLLERLEVTGDDGVRSMTATSLYRVLAHYGNGADRDGRYRAADGSLRRMPGGAAFIDRFDLEREQGSVLPLLYLVAPEWMAGFAESVLAQNRLAGGMVGRVGNGTVQAGDSFAPALPVLASMVAFDVPGVEAERVLPPMLKTVTVPDRDLPWADFQALGYFPYDRVDGRSLPLTLEVSRAHRAVAGVGAALGDRAVAAEHLTRTLFYRRLFSPEAGQFCARNRQGDWRPDCALPVDVGAPGQESGRRNIEALLWAPARFDIDGVIALLGGRQVLARRLDVLFSEAAGPAGGPVYDHDDPAFHHAPWLYAFSNTPERTGRRVREVFEQAGPLAADSIEQSAWRVFAVLGLYPVLHGQGEYVLGAPLVPAARLSTPRGELRIERVTPEVSADAAVLMLDDVPLPGRTVSHRRLVRGASLTFQVADPTGG